MLPKFVGIFILVVLIELLVFTSLPKYGFFISIVPAALGLKYSEIPFKSLCIIILLYGYLKDVVWATNPGEYWLGYIVLTSFLVALHLYKKRLPKYQQNKINQYQQNPIVFILLITLVPYIIYLFSNFNDVSTGLWLKYVSILSLITLVLYKIIFRLQKTLARWV